MNRKRNLWTTRRESILCAVVLFGGLVGEAVAIKDATNQGRWETPTKVGPDAKVPGFLVNMGPTGARGILKEDSYIVKYVFSGSPATEMLKLEDEVYGANGKKFGKHTFGGASNSNGLEGPLQDLGLAIEDSEGEDGVLELMVKRGGEKLEVAVQLEKLGRFADTFPVNCEKTKILKERAYKYLMDNPGGLDSQGRCVATLAMLSSNDKKVSRAGEEMALQWNEPYREDTWAWHLGFQGVALSEYHLLTGDRKVLKTLKRTMDLMELAQWKAPIRHYDREKMKNPVSQEVLNKHQDLYEGGFGHAPYTVIAERGGGGYGPMQWPTCLALMTWQLAGDCGVEFDPASPERSYTFLDMGTNDGGKVSYGGEFTLNNGPVDWTNWKKSTQHKFAPKSGLAYIVHQLSDERDESSKMMKLHLENIDAAYKDLPNGHACAMMGFTWGLAGVYASDDEKLKRKISNYYKAWFNLARCHGSDSYVILPGRDYADSSYYRRNIRNHTTAAMAFIYSFSTPKLRVQGATGEASEAADEEKVAFLKADDSKNRVFTSQDGARSFEGVLVVFDPQVGIVRIRQRNGRTVDVDFAKLSKADQEYLLALGSKE